MKLFLYKKAEIGLLQLEDGPRQEADSQGYKSLILKILAGSSFFLILINVYPILYPEK